MPAPTKINGYPVLHSRPVSGGFAVLCYRETHEFHPYVVATWVPGEDGWHHGDYQSDLPSAMTAFERRAA